VQEQEREQDYHYNPIATGHNDTDDGMRRNRIVDSGKIT
jgi:hypothetical protein